MADKLKIGILDLLTILLPGGFLLLLLGNKIVDFINATWQGYQFAGQWIFLVIALGLAYILGHFIFLVGAFLDDLVYEKVRKVYWPYQNKLTAYVLMLKEKRTGITERKVLNGWKWSCSWLIANEPEIYSEVERHMAESKFFRSLVVVLIAGAIVFFIKGESWQTMLIFLLLIFFSLIRYLTQRHKSIEAAYHGIITTCNEVLPREPDPVIYADVKKGVLYPNEKLYKKIQDNNERGKQELRLDKFGYAILSFFYTIGICIIPGFSFLMRSKRKKEEARQKRKEEKTGQTLRMANAQRNKMIPSQHKPE